MKFLSTFFVPVISLLLMFIASEHLNLIFFGQITTIFSAAFLLAILAYFGAGQSLLSSGYEVQTLPKEFNSELNCVLIIGFIVFIASLFFKNFNFVSIVLVAIVVYLGKFYLLQQQLGKQSTQLAIAFYIFHIFKICIIAGILLFQINSILSFSIIVFFVSAMFIVYLKKGIKFSTEDINLNLKSRKLFFLTSLFSLASSNMTQLGVFMIFGSSYAGVFAFFMLFYGGVSLYLNKFFLAKHNKCIVNPNIEEGRKSHKKAFLHVKISCILTFFSCIGVNVSWLFGFFLNYQPYSLSINILFMALLIRCYTAWQGVWGNREGIISTKNKIQMIYFVLLILSLVLGKFLQNFVYFALLFFISEVILLLLYQIKFSKYNKEMVKF